MIDHTTTLVEVPENFGDLRYAAVANALWATDLRASDSYDTTGKVAPFQPKPDEGTGEFFRSLLGPSQASRPWQLDRPFRAWKDANGQTRTEGTSTCGLVASGLLRRIINLSMWDGPYWQWPGKYYKKDIVSCLTQLGFDTNSRGTT